MKNGGIKYQTYRQRGHPGCFGRVQGDIEELDVPHIPGHPSLTLDIYYVFYMVFLWFSIWIYRDDDGIRLGD